MANILNTEQFDFINEVKRKVREAQYAALKVVGKSISEKQATSWGKAVVPTLSAELQQEFSGIGGFSEGNLWLMAQFYSEYQSDENLVPLVREISWTKK